MAQLRKREPPPRLRLRVELRLPNLSGFVRHGWRVYGHTSRWMDRRERMAIMSEGPIRQDHARDQAEGRALERDTPFNPLAGKALRRRLRNFTVSTDRYALSRGGPLPWMQRLRRIEEETDAHEAQLREAWDELAATCHGADFARRWGTLAESWPFYAVNDLIERHNRYFPAESQLPMNPRTGDFVPVNGKPYRREPLDARWILERFPLDALRVDVDHGG
jgi:hypothetical protein